MSDYNDGLLPEPCLRMDTHFGDEYESVEFGDGTGYVKAATALARLGALHVELDELRDGNAKLRELVRDMYLCSDETCTDCEHHDYSGEGFWCKRGIGWKKARMRELGVEVDG